MSNSDKNNTASNAEQSSTQTDEEQERWLAVRRERLARERRRNLAIVSSVAVVALLLLFLLLWKWRSSSTAEVAETPVVSVRVAKVEKQTIAAPVSAVGTIFPREQATVAAKISAQIRSMALLKNQVVRAGQIIAVLESRDLVAQRTDALSFLFRWSGGAISFDRPWHQQISGLLRKVSPAPAQGRDCFRRGADCRWPARHDRQVNLVD